MHPNHLVETPRLFTRPARELNPETSRGFEAVAFAETVIGLRLMPWQVWALHHLLELAPDGSYRHRTALVLTGRQAGTSTLLQVLALRRLYVDRAGLVLGSAQSLGLAEEVWDGAVAMVQGTPDPAAEVAAVVRTNGGEALRLVGGERYKVVAATRSGGRGSSSDSVMSDELREHTSWDAWSALARRTTARPSAQVVGYSNAGDRRSGVLATLREEALAALDDPTGTLGLFEWSAPAGCDLDDPSAWCAANPALGHRMDVQALRSALETDPEEVFRTEVLCPWVTALDGAFSLPAWEALADPDATPDHQGDAGRPPATPSSGALAAGSSRAGATTRADASALRRRDRGPGTA